MVAGNLHLHFLPRSLQLNMSKNNNNNAGKPKGESNQLPTDDEQKKKRKRKEENKNIPATEEDCVLLENKKLKTKKKNKDGAFSANVSSELEELVAGFLSSRRLSNTLSTFLSETKRVRTAKEYTGKAHKVRLEDIYHSYCDQIHESPRKKNAAKVEVNSLGKADLDLKLNEENKKNQDEEGKYGKKIDAHMASRLIKTSNGSSIAKTCTSEKDPYRSDRSKGSGIEAVDDFSAHTKRERREKAKKNPEKLTGIHKDKGSAKLSNTSNEVEQVLDHPEPVCESQNSKGEKKKKEAASDEKNQTDNDKQIGGKKSKKMTTQVETKAQPMKSLTLYEAADKTKNADLVQDLENWSNIELPKKEKRKKQKKIDELSSRDIEKNHDTKKETMARGTPLATALNTFKKESNIESVEDLSADPSRPQKFEQSNQERKKSLQMNSEDKTEQNSNRKNKKEKKALEKIQAAFSCATRGVKGTRENLCEETGNTRGISQADEIFDTNRYSIGESEALEKGSAGTLSQNSMLGNQDDSKQKDQHFSPKLMKDKQERSDKNLQDGADNGYGAKAQEIFEQVTGKDFRHEKTKKR